MLFCGAGLGPGVCEGVCRYENCVWAAGRDPDGLVVFVHRSPTLGHAFAPAAMMALLWRRATGPARFASSSCASRTGSRWSRPTDSFSPHDGFNGDDHDEDEYSEYYDDDDDGFASGSSRGQPPSFTHNVPHALRHGEFLRQVSLPDALEAALEECTVPRLRGTLKAAKQAHKAGVVDRPPTVEDFVAFRLDRSYGACYRVLHELRCRMPTFAPDRVLEFGAYVGSGSWAAHELWPPTSEPSAALTAARRHTAVEPNPKLRATGAELCDSAGAAAPAIEWRAAMPCGKMPHASESQPPPSDVAASAEAMGSFELVIAPYSLSALPPAGIPRALEMLWRHTAVGGVLALLDATNEPSLDILQRARALLEAEAEGARLLAPFPHDGRGATSIFDEGAAQAAQAEPWPMKAWKRSFSKGGTLQLTQRVLESNAAREHGQRTDRLRRGNERKVRAESFAYLLFRKEGPEFRKEGPEFRKEGPEAESTTIAPAAAAAAVGTGADAARIEATAAAAARPLDGMWGRMPYGRVLGTPRKRTRHILLDVLTPSGQMATFTVSKRKASRADYRYVRKAMEGNTVPMALFEGSPEAQRWH